MENEKMLEVMSAADLLLQSPSEQEAAVCQHRKLLCVSSSFDEVCKILNTDACHDKNRKKDNCGRKK